ncbi:hypothetical protein WNY37_06210 [Henriciella sp. AS95]|uniref:hypothetical protein n=1 Tax=Henriciella sp. AS95 TaxID=3135782 RepID=UPI003175F960
MSSSNLDATAAMHFREAESSALQIMSVTYALLPREFRDELGLIVAPLIYRFAFHFRALAERIRLDLSAHKLPQKSIVIINEHVEVDDNIGRSLNRIIHSDAIAYNWAPPHQPQFTFDINGFVMLSYIKANTDRYKDQKVVPLREISRTFLESRESIKRGSPPRLKSVKWVHPEPVNL